MQKFFDAIQELFYFSQSFICCFDISWIGTRQKII